MPFIKKCPKMSDSACTRVSVWLPGLTRQDRLFLWWLAYRCPECPIDLATLSAACQTCRTRTRGRSSS